MGSRIVGIAGGSGAGKTTLARALVRALGADRTVWLPGDAYYRDRGGASGAGEPNFDHPAALELDLLAAQLDGLRAGEAVARPVYDFARHRREERTVRVEPRSFVLVEGVLVLADASVRARLDLKVWVETPSDLRVLRRIERDVSERGRDLASVRRQYEATVRPMHERFAEPSRRFADLEIRGDATTPEVAPVLERLGPIPAQVSR